jgi:hypothetical protein
MAVGSLLSLVGCDGGRAFVDNSGPNVKNPTIDPTLLARFVGGQVVISAVVTDESGVKRVTAQVVRQSDGQFIADVSLQRVGSNRYEVTIVAPANTRTDGQSEVYKVTLFAVDKGGQKTKKADGTFEVPAPPAAPPPPNP